MHSAPEFLKALTIVLGVSAVVTVAFHWLRQPVVLGYLIAGLIIGPHVPIPLVADRAIVQTLSELGVILLMFSLGLEFSIRKLVQVGPTAGVTAVLESSLMVWLGVMVGRELGWTILESLFTGAAVAISSTTIIAKIYEELGIKGAPRGFVVGVLIVEDLIAVVLMAALTAIASGKGLSASALAATTGRLAAFLAALVVVGLLVVPRLMRAVVALKRPETTLISAVAICFGISLIALALGYSVALGAFLAGSLVSESGEEKTIDELIAPVRDMFAAVFFVSVGMMIDPALVVRHWYAVAALTATVIGGKVLGVTLGAFLTGNGVRTAVQSGMSLAQIGEFSYIIAGLGMALGATREFLYPVVVSVSAVTSLSTPWLIRASGATAGFVDRHLPRPLQTFAALYGTWIAGLRAAPRGRTRGAAVRRLIRRLLVDALFLLAIAIGTAVSLQRAVAILQRSLSLSPEVLRWLVVLAAVVVSLPFVAGVVRVSRRLAMLLARVALPDAAAGRTDLAAAPRGMLVAAIQLTLVLLVGGPLVAVTQPFLPGVHAAVALALLLAMLAAGFWRSARNLQGHVRAGAEVIVEALQAQSRAPKTPIEQALAKVRGLLPGLGEPALVALGETSNAVGKTLAQMNLRGLTGATVLAIHRGGGDVLVPNVDEALQAGDVLALAGTDEALQQARQVLTGAPPPPGGSAS